MNDSQTRLDVVDAARGVAVVAMIAYHGLWDLVSFDLIQVDLFTNPWWLAVRTAILGTFLFIAGLGQGLSAERGIDRRRFLRRLGVLVAAAAVVTAASLPLFPDSPIFFGVLHHVAVASVLGLFFRRMPWWLTAAVGIGVLAVAGRLAHPFFDQSWLRWVGLMTFAPRSNDYVPLVPWFGVVLLGIAAGRLWPRTDAVARWRSHHPAGRAVTWIGRRSLLIYLGHQPILFGGLWLAVTLIPSLQPTPLDTFVTSCQPVCEASGMTAVRCEQACRCAGNRMQAEDLLPLLAVPDRLSAEQRQRVDGIVGACR